MDRIIVSSFNHYTIRSMEGKMPGIKNRCTVCGWNYKCGRLCGGCCAGRCSASGVDENFYPNYLEDCRRRNILVHVWTINNEEDMRRCCEMGLDAIITNYPDVARKSGG